MPAKSEKSFWPSQRVLVTGGAGFLGGFLVEALKTRGVKEITVPRSKDYDLRDASAIERLLKTSQPTLIVHLAATCGGIEANRARPADFFYDNAMMGIQLMHQAWKTKVQKFVQVGTVCAYPKFTPVPFKESDLWNGYPEETNAPYGLAKKMLLVQAQAYRAQHGFNTIYLLPANLYGPRDNFDLKTSHVIPAMIRKFVEAKDRGDQSVKLWGTGSPTREFLFVQDAAEGILEAAERYNAGEPCNLGTGSEIAIKDLAHLIKQLTGYEGSIVWDSSLPDGQPRRWLDHSAAEQRFGFKAGTALEQGLKKTIEWYRTQNSPSLTDRRRK